jgi:hypothetical protein
VNLKAQLEEAINIEETYKGQMEEKNIWKLERKEAEKRKYFDRSSEGNN